MENSDEYTNFCTSCYTPTRSSYKLCYECNRDKCKIKRCRGTVIKTGEQCRYVTTKGLCYFHKKKDTNGVIYYD